MSSERIEDVHYPWSLPRGLIILLGLAAALVAALGMREFKQILGPVFLALVLSIAVHPVRRFADRRRWPAWVGIILSLLAVYGIVAGLFAILVVAGIQFATLLQDYAPQFQAFLQQAAQLLESVGVSPQAAAGPRERDQPKQAGGRRGKPAWRAGGRAERYLLPDRAVILHGG